MGKAIESLNHVMAAETSDKTVKAEAILEILQKQPKKQRVKLFEYVLFNFKTIEKNCHKLGNLGLSELTWDVLIKNESRNVRQKIETLLEKRPATTIICRKLWNYLLSFKTREEKIFVLTLVLYHKCMPLLSDEERKGAVTMPQKEWQKIKENLDPQADTIIEIKKGGFETWAEMASAILYQLGQVDTPQAKAFLMVVALLPIRPRQNGKKDFPGVVDVSDEKFEQYKEVFKEKITRLVKILETEFFKQKTEKAGAILSFILGQKDKDSQIILLSHILRLVTEENPFSKRGVTVIEVSGGESILGKLLAQKLSGKCDSCEKTECPAHPSHGA